MKESSGDKVHLQTVHTGFSFFSWNWISSSSDHLLPFIKLPIWLINKLVYFLNKMCDYFSLAPPGDNRGFN